MWRCVYSGLGQMGRIQNGRNLVRWLFPSRVFGSEGASQLSVSAAEIFSRMRFPMHSILSLTSKSFLVVEVQGEA